MKYAVLTALIATSLSLLLTSAGASDAPRISVATGDVSVADVVARPGVALEDGAVLVCGPDSSAVLALGSGATLRLAADSAIEAGREEGDLLLTLRRGKAELEVTGRTVRLRVAGGEAAVTGPGGSALALEAGDAAVLTATAEGLAVASIAGDLVVRGESAAGLVRAGETLDFPADPAPAGGGFALHESGLDLVLPTGLHSRPKGELEVKHARRVSTCGRVSVRVP